MFRKNAFAFFEKKMRKDDTYSLFSKIYYYVLSPSPLTLLFAGSSNTRDENFQRELWESEHFLNLLINFVVLGGIFYFGDKKIKG